MRRGRTSRWARCATPSAKCGASGARLPSSEAGRRSSTRARGSVRPGLYLRAVRVLRHLRDNVIAYVALFVALSGSAVAAGVALPRNSVGTAQLQANAVVSSKVKNGSLLVADFRPGQIPA